MKYLSQEDLQPGKDYDIAVKQWEILYLYLLHGYYIHVPVIRPRI
jgi:hypothetical protein